MRDSRDEKVAQSSKLNGRWGLSSKFKVQSSKFKVQGKDQAPITKRGAVGVRPINHCDSSCRSRRCEMRVRLPRPMRHERGEGRGEGCPTLADGLAVTERLLSPTLSSVPNGGKGAGSHGPDGTNSRKAGCLPFCNSGSRASIHAGATARRSRLMAALQPLVLNQLQRSA